VGDGSAAVSTGVGDGAAESVIGSVGVGLGASVGNSSDVGVERTGVAVEDCVAVEDVPQATNRSEKRNRDMKTLMNQSFCMVIYG
jgi:hypothetical protein